MNTLKEKEMIQIVNSVSYTSSEFQWERCAYQIIGVGRVHM